MTRALAAGVFDKRIGGPEEDQKGPVLAWHRMFQLHFLCLSKDTVKWRGIRQCQISTDSMSFAVKATLSSTSCSA